MNKNPVGSAFRTSCSAFAIILLAALAIAQEPAQVPAPEPGVAAAPRPFLWRIEGATPSYLFGTIHLADERVVELPDVVADALDEADAVYTELPLELDAEQIKNMQRVTVLPEGERLRDLVPTDVYARLETYVKRNGMPMTVFERMKIWVIVSQLPMLARRELLLGTPLDMRIYQEGQRERKEVGGIETFDEQVGVFERFSVAEQVELLRGTLDDLDAADMAGEDRLEQLILLYLSGDAEELSKELGWDEVADEQLRARLRHALLTERNLRMADRMTAHIRAATDRGCFFAVGAAHLPGADGVVALLEARGFILTRLPERAADLEQRIHELETELTRLRARLTALRKAG